MKKLTLMLASLLLSVGSAFAEQLVADGIYTIQGGNTANSQDGHRGYLAAGEGYADYPVLSEIGWTTYSSNGTTAIENGKMWYVTSKNDGATYLIYNVGLNKFLSGEGGQVNFSSIPYEWEIVQNTQNNVAYTSIKYVSFACGSSAADRNVNYHWQAEDGGSCHVLAMQENGLATYATQVAAAETEINTLRTIDDLSNTVIYTVSTADRGSWLSNGTSLTSTTKVQVSVDANSVAQQFAFLRTDNTPVGEYYIYSIADSKFVTKYGGYTMLTDDAIQPVKFLESPSTSCNWVIAFDGVAHIGISNSYTPGVITFYNSLTDAGNQVKIVAVTENEADIQAALSKIDAAYTQIQLPGSGLESVTALEEGKKYLIYDANDGRYGFHYDYYDDIKKNTINLNSTERLDKTYVWTVEADGDNWKIRNEFSGMYIKAVTSGANQGVGETGESFKVTYDGNNKTFTLKNTSNDYYWNGNPGNLAGWSDAHPMKFIEVTESMQKQYCDVSIIISEKYCDYSCNIVKSVEAGTSIESFMPSFFVVSDGAISDATISGTNRFFTLEGSWSFPFELNKVYRVKNHAGNRTDYYNFFYDINTKKILTKNDTDEAAFVPERLFYLTSTGFDSNGNLLVVLRNVLADENTGFTTATGNNNNGTFTTSPTTLIVATNNTDNTNGFSLRHSGNAASYINDYQGNGSLGVWNDAASSQNDSGSCLRFYALADDDFNGLLSGDNATFVTEEKVNTAKASHSTADVRALFADYSDYVYSVADANTVLSGLEGYTAEHFGDAPGYFSGTSYDQIASLVAALQATYEGKDADAVVAATEALSEEIAKITLNLPEAGKFYRVKSVVSGNIVSAPDDGSTGVQMVMSGKESANNILYLDSDKHLLVYGTGLYINGKNHAVLGNKDTYDFQASKNKTAGAFAIKPGSANYWHDNNSLLDVYSGGAVAQCDWYVEEVDYLPVAIDATSNSGTIYSPVELGLTEKNNVEVKAYTGLVSEDGAKFIVEEQTVVPANTGVIVSLVKDQDLVDGCVYLKIQESTVADVNNDLTGALATAAIPTDMVIYTFENYTYTDGQTDKTSTQFEVTAEDATTLKGFTAYLKRENGPNTIAIFDSTGTNNPTGIEEVGVTENAGKTVIYDLQGRRLSAPVKGINIINGKKVLVK